MSATGALIAMAAQCGGAAAFDGLQHLHVMPGNPAMAVVDEGLSSGTDDIGHLQERPAHLRLLLCVAFLGSGGQHQCVQRACRGAEMASGKMQVDGGFFQITMPQQQLNRAQIGAALQQVGGKTVTQCVGMDLFLLQAARWAA